MHWLKFGAASKNFKSFQDNSGNVMCLSKNVLKALWEFFLN